jgi:hypothetical protein
MRGSFFPTDSFMKSALALIATLLLSGCPSQVDPAAVREAEVFFPPRFRYVEKPRYCFSAAERERALQEYRAVGADTLFEFVIDGEGKVMQARIVRTDQPRHRHEDIVAHARVMVFSPDAESDLYRAFYFPAQYTYKSEFEWADR